MYFFLEPPWSRNFCTFALSVLNREIRALLEDASGALFGETSRFSIRTLLARVWEAAEPITCALPSASKIPRASKYLVIPRSCLVAFIGAKTQGATSSAIRRNFERNWRNRTQLRATERNLRKCTFWSGQHDGP